MAARHHHDAATDVGTPPEPADGVRRVADAVKPRLRGWLHTGTAPLALVAGVVLVVLAPTTAGKVSTAVFALSAVVLFGCSAVYHRGTWSPRAAAVLRRLDHSNIFLLIAGTYTPLAVLLLDRSTATVLLVVVWTGAALGIAARLVWLNAPRWVYVPIYVALGWVALAFLPQFWTTGGPAVVWLVAGGGLAYTLGALVYALKRPNPSPRWFGFHEIFHVGTVVGFACHYVAVLLAAHQA
ncbi:hemolysin III family protein [Georgenia yuyongxinii]|uniref:Hemolysin III family protein n=1 Tax=Georgenia yuyongxinii TaxID=2589797 RepID=A0A5B8C0J2_9MICO|nr:hemolysin III family protein [Georgenia yuyongxinii]QDC23958.1 hemolysin III family protein [Georgenia yuyongxinii]